MNTTPGSILDAPDPFAPDMLRPEIDPNVRAWSLYIPGEPVAKGRPKITTAGGFARAYTPAKTRRFEDIVRQTAVMQWRRPLIAGRPIWIDAEFARSIPDSWAKKKKQQALLHMVRPIGRPDLDNLLKAITDGLNGVVYLDDALIVEVTAKKIYAEIPGVTVTLTWL